jgi:hypothetical protein
VAATVRRAAQALADAGYAVEEACPQRYEDAANWARLIIGDFGSVLGMLSPMMGAEAMAFVKQLQRDCGAISRRGSFFTSDGRARRHRSGMVDLHGGPAATAFAHLDTVALRTWLRFGNASRNGGNQGTDAPGGAGQSARTAVGLRACRP